ncbi:hypothetical protein TNCV_4631861 [Trichonephila clavipes]|nr:hypothetical protein TNCV_4631861 [Trichonephila clavipes]
MVVKAEFSSSALQVETTVILQEKKTIYDLILAGCSLHHADDPTSQTSSSCNTPPPCRTNLEHWLLDRERKCTDQRPPLSNNDGPCIIIH